MMLVYVDINFDDEIQALKLLHLFLEYCSKEIT